MNRPDDIVPVLPGAAAAADVAWPLHHTAHTHQVEARAMLGLAPGALMERAGLAVARLSLALAPHAQHIAVFCGPGNNGGDGLVAARRLLSVGKKVQVYLLADAARLPVDAAAAYQRAAAAGVSITAGPATGFAEQPRAGLLIDALLGIGARRAPAADMALAIPAINQHGAPVLSVDLPSGLHPDTGALLGADAVRASATLALLTLKPGCFTGHGREQAGAVWWAALGVDAGPASASLTAAPQPVARQHSSHKGSFGDVLVVAGAPGKMGAARLAGRAALAAGVGRVWISFLDVDASQVDATRPELMFTQQAWLADPARWAQTSVVCGCGGGDAVREALPALLAHAGRLVLDADALNAIAADTCLRRLLQNRSARGRPTVLTPHPLEAARLLGCTSSAVQRDRLAAAQNLADEYGCTVLLKGSGTVVAAPNSRPRINPTGNAALASAGTGDVLAGWLGGRWAQQPQAAAQDVAAAAAWWHGYAADQHLLNGQTGPLRAADLVESMARQPGV